MKNIMPMAITCAKIAIVKERVQACQLEKNNDRLAIPFLMSIIEKKKDCPLARFSLIGEKKNVYRK